MIEVTNKTLLESQEALQRLAKAGLRGVFALRLADIISAVEDQGQKLHQVRTDLWGRAQEEDITEAEAQEQWEEVLEKTCEIEEEKLPRSALRSADDLTAGDVLQLRWLLEEKAGDES